jgi:hypothetical protein
MATASIAGLISFMRSQPADRPVDHDSWKACAVGDYAREVLGVEINGNGDSAEEYAVLTQDPVVRTLYQDVGTDQMSISLDFGAPLCARSTMMDYLSMCDHGDGSTYGTLLTNLYRYFPLIVGRVL